MSVLCCVLLLLAAPKEPDVRGDPKVWTRLPPPRKGDWLHEFPEKGQTLAEYKASKPIRETAERKTIVLLPFLTRRPPRDDIVQDLAAHLAAFFQRRVRVLEGAALPDGAYDPKRRQVALKPLARDLYRRLPKDALFLLAVTDRDLYSKGLNHTLGWGSFRLRIGVVSTFRLGAASQPLRWRRRLWTLATHEASHMLSMAHCVFYECLMNGALKVDHSDQRPAGLCPVCRAKLQWNLGLDLPDRYRKLLQRFEGQGLKGDAKHLRAAMAELAR